MRACQLRVEAFFQKRAIRARPWCIYESLLVNFLAKVDALSAFGAHCLLIARQRARTGKRGWTRSQERALMQRALAEARGDQSVAAKSPHTGRDALRYKMKKYNLL